ncbi:hypothetical protein GGTG_09085 [Gaeumannomyces tritici R3-111a-1]|uniref:Uncharacterized protein n=1 Tax=Gaeumannomyces tritici (strain R3-111a-1) TaxID=644352 RepID=J3P6E5_GAET3|nr:hypothetical protein GGTG_09085 [Gaeumannomyces tritici R3-111a-1]EJT72219.1 hypothetical protein GGTG_09085 [Gaeumannomyces tritici R3-111a-1]
MAEARCINMSTGARYCTLAYARLPDHRWIEVGSADQRIVQLETCHLDLPSHALFALKHAHLVSGPPRCPRGHLEGKRDDAPCSKSHKASHSDARSSRSDGRSGDDYWVDFQPGTTWDSVIQEARISVRADAHSGRETRWSVPDLPYIHRVQGENCMSFSLFLALDLDQVHELGAADAARVFASSGKATTGVLAGGEWPRQIGLRGCAGRRAPVTLQTPLDLAHTATAPPLS